MNDRIKLLIEQAGYITDPVPNLNPGADPRLEKFAELLLRNLADELLDVAERSKKTNPEWANGMNHAAMLAQRMTMALPQWPEAE